MTQTTPTLREAVDAYRQLGRRLRTDEPLDPADEEMLKRLEASKKATEAVVRITRGAAETHAKRLKEAAKRKEEAKAFAKRAEKAMAKALATMKEEAAQACVRTLKNAAAEEGAAMQAFAKRQEEAAAKAFDQIATLELKTRFLIDDCVEARQIHAGKHQEQVARLREAPDYEKMLGTLDAWKEALGPLDEHENEAIRMMGVALGDRWRRLEYDRLSTSRRGDQTAARSEAIAWIKSSVRRLSGRTNAKHVMALCDVVLGGTTSAAAVKEAVTKEELLDRRFQ